MFKVTKAAGVELKRSMQAHDFDDMPLRVAAQRVADGSFEYQMGFDEAGPGDTMVSSGGIDVVIAKDHKPLLNGTELDFVELDEGGQHFIFKNPNDPSYIAPRETDTEVETDSTSGGSSQSRTTPGKTDKGDEK